MIPRTVIVCTLLMLALFVGSVSAATDSAVVWKRTLGISPVGSLSMTSDGSYIAAGGTDGNIYLLNNQGGVLWNNIVTDLSGQSRNPSVAIHPLGTSVFAGGGTKIYSYDRAGTKQWSNDTGVNVYGVAISTDGYGFSTGKNTLRFFTTNDAASSSSDNIKPIVLQIGDAHTRTNTALVNGITYTTTETYYITKNTVDIFSINTAAPMWKVAMSRDGGFVGAGTLQDHHAYLYDRTGDQRWSFDTVSPVSDVEIAYNGTFLAAGAGHSVYLLDKAGNLRWRYDAPDTVNGVSINRDGNVIGVGIQDGSIVILDQDGKTLWSGKLDNTVQDIASDSSGVQFGVSSGTMVYLLNPTFALSMTTVPTAPVSMTDGAVSLSSEPVGAGVYIDNAYRGITPVTITDLSTGSHTILLRKEGYQDWTSTIELIAGTPVSLSGVLTSLQAPTKSGIPTVAFLVALSIMILVAHSRKKR